MDLEDLFGCGFAVVVVVVLGMIVVKCIIVAFHVIF